MGQSHAHAHAHAHPNRRDVINPTGNIYLLVDGGTRFYFVPLSIIDGLYDRDRLSSEFEIANLTSYDAYCGKTSPPGRSNTRTRGLIQPRSCVSQSRSPSPKIDKYLQLRRHCYLPTRCLVCMLAKASLRSRSSGDLTRIPEPPVADREIVKCYTRFGRVR